jgi:hypothetical protein
MSVDPVTFQVIVSRLSGIVQEMQDRIFRTGYSTIVRESQDASCLILDADGAVVGEHVIIALHLACLPQAVRAIRMHFGADIHPGDAFLTNDPYLGAVPHSIDMAILTPVFAGSRLVAFVGNIAHKSDLGGVLPGTGYAGAREVFQEGVIYRPVRFVAGGTVSRDIEAIVRANTRTPDLVMGDLYGCRTSRSGAFAPRSPRGRTAVSRARRTSRTTASSWSGACATTSASRSAATGSSSISPVPTTRRSGRSTSCHRRRVRRCISR